MAASCGTTKSASLKAGSFNYFSLSTRRVLGFVQQSSKSPWHTLRQNLPCFRGDLLDSRLDPFRLSSCGMPDSHDLKQLTLMSHTVNHSVRPNDHLSNTRILSFRCHAPHLGEALKPLHSLNQAQTKC